VFGVGGGWYSEVCGVGVECGGQCSELGLGVFGVGGEGGGVFGVRCGVWGVGGAE
jgi:hypothetical protein